MITPGDRFKALLNSKGWTAGSLAVKTGVSQDAIYKILRGERVPTMDTIVKLARALDMPLEEIVGIFQVGYTAGRSSALPSNAIPGPPPGAPMVRVPIYGSIKAGGPSILAVQSDDEYLEVYAERLASPDAYYLRVQGDSMLYEGIIDGSLVQVRPTDDEIEDGALMVVIIDNAEGVVKRVKNRNRDTVELHSANPAYPTMVEARSNVRVVGEVVEVYTDKRKSRR